MVSLPPGKHKKKAPKTPLTKTLPFGIIKVQRARTPELIFVRVHWDTVSFLTMHTWLFLYAAMMQNIITISKINLRDKCFFSLQRKFRG